jgi:ABC-2 type transport system permease protein
MYFLWPGVLAAVLQQVLLLGLALFASELKMAAFKKLVQNAPRLKLMSVNHSLSDYEFRTMDNVLFTLWFRIPFYDNLLPTTFVAGVFVISVSFIEVLVSILVPNQLKRPKFDGNCYA